MSTFFYIDNKHGDGVGWHKLTESEKILLIMKSSWSRQEFLRFIDRTVGATTVALVVVSRSDSGSGSATGVISPVAPGTVDEVALADGLGYEFLVS